MEQLTTKGLRLAAVFFALSGTVLAGEFQITLTGSVESNTFWTGPYAGSVAGDTAVLTYTVSTPGVPLVPGQLSNYAIVPQSFDLFINGSTGAELAGDTDLQIQNDSLTFDGFRINQTLLASGHYFSSGFEALGTMFPSNDIQFLTGTYDVGSFLHSKEYYIVAHDGQLEINPETLTIETPPSIVTFCDPGNQNSTGNAAALIGIWGTGTGSGLHLECGGGVPGELGYFLVGDTANDPGTTVSDGQFCLIGGISQFYRYNLDGTSAHSVGLFDGSGLLQNFAGTSTVGSGFDVPLSIPGAGTTIMAGDTWHFQVWHRDTPSGSGRSNFSNGLSVTF